MNRPTIKCRCGKVYGLDEADARRIHRYIVSKNGNTNPVRFYACGFGGWHWTSKVDVLPAPTATPEPATPEFPAKVCHDCGKQYTPVADDQKFCTKTCRQQADMKKYAARRRQEMGLHDEN